MANVIRQEGEEELAHDCSCPVAEPALSGWVSLGDFIHCPWPQFPYLLWEALGV